MMYGFGWAGWLGGAVVMIGFWVLVFWAGVSLVRRPRPAGDSRAASEVLDARFARGEIDADEYTRRREALRARAGDDVRG